MATKKDSIDSKVHCHLHTENASGKIDGDVEKEGGVRRSVQASDSGQGTAECTTSTQSPGAPGFDVTPQQPSDSDNSKQADSRQESRDSKLFECNCVNH